MVWTKNLNILTKCWEKDSTGNQFISVDLIHGHAVSLSIIYSKIYEEEYHDAKTNFFISWVVCANL